MPETASAEQLSNVTRRVVALVGNPNTGKSTLFNALSGHHQHVGNYPGATVEKRSGLLRRVRDGLHVELIDLPGAYSFAAQSEDEAIVHDVVTGRLQSAMPDLVVIVIDASNLGRNLFLASQILDLQCPTVVALNMMDVAAASGLRIDLDALAKELGVPVVPVVGSKGRGIEELTRTIVDSLDRRPSVAHNGFPPVVHEEVSAFADTIADSLPQLSEHARRVVATQTLLGAGSFHEQRAIREHGPAIAGEIVDRRKRIESTGSSLVELEAEVRYRWIDEILQRVTSRTSVAKRRRSEQIDRILTHRWIGLVVFAALMTICFQAIYTWAGPLMNLIDEAFSGLGQSAASVMSEGPLQSLVSNGIIAGVGAVLVFLPQILILFLFIAVLEDCGYMSRAAFLLDRWMGMAGLNGNSFIPLMSSFACAVPGILATRTIANRRDRLVTILIAPLMSCSARLPVYVLLIGAFVPATPLLGGVVTAQALTLLGLYLVGVVIAICVALVLRLTILKGVSQPFLLELPSYKWPSPRTIMLRVYTQGKEFCITAGTIIFAVSILIWALGYYPHPRSIAMEHDAMREAARATFAASDHTNAGETRLTDQLALIDNKEAGAYLRHSVLGRLGQWIEPIVMPLGWDWRIGTAVVASFPAREIVISTMGTIYNLGEGVDEHSEGLRSQLQKAQWPNGRHVFDLPVALSIMVFFALCCQCVATLATIKRETRSWRWPLFTFAYMTTLGYTAAYLTYRIASRMI